MKEIVLLDQMKETAYLLYQNKEQDGIEGVMRLLEQFQDLLNQMTEKQMEEVGSFALMMMRELLETFQSQDILGMADCLMEKSVLFVQYYFQTQE